MKKFIFFLLGIIILQLPLAAQPKEIKFKFSAESNVNNASSIELNISKLLSAINDACIDSKPISYTDIRIDSTAVKNLDSFWQNMHFYCEDELNVSKCLEGLLGFQVRDIPITLKPQVSFDEGLQRELTVTLTKTGVITAVHLALPNYQVKDILEEGKTVTEVQERSEILKFIEDLRCFFISKNYDALQKLLSEDVFFHLEKNNSIDLGERVANQKDAKTEYLARLKQLIRNETTFDIDFDQIIVKRHRAKPQYYGVNLHQCLKTKVKVPDGKVYNGWFFILWDFSDQQTPLIPIITWQSDEYVKDHDDVFDIKDLKL